MRFVPLPYWKANEYGSAMSARSIVDDYLSRNMWEAALGVCVLFPESTLDLCGYAAPHVDLSCPYEISHQKDVENALSGRCPLPSGWTLIRRGLLDFETRRQAKWLAQRVTDEKEFKTYWAVLEALNEYA